MDNKKDFYPILKNFYLFYKKGCLLHVIFVIIRIQINIF